MPITLKEFRAATAALAETTPLMIIVRTTDGATTTKLAGFTVAGTVLTKPVDQVSISAGTVQAS